MPCGRGSDLLLARVEGCPVGMNLTCCWHGVVGCPAGVNLTVRLYHTRASLKEAQDFLLSKSKTSRHRRLGSAHDRVRIPGAH